MSISRPVSTKTPEEQSRRVFVGNLDPTVDEFIISQLFQKYGKITGLDFLFHTAGPLQGQPRGYCFVEYSKREEAMKAISELNSKRLRGRPLVVNLSRSAMTNPNKSGSYQFRNAHLLKTKSLANASLESKIQAMEKKLTEMNQAAKEPASTSGKVKSPLKNGSKATATNHERYSPYPSKCRKDK
ncbi:RNA-binding domain-containing protein [Basidiobolus meristosporus CBS 931.73]|uniref:Probable RNA-binding protein 18 n=1 Tax=Basidiobolus meristosporus CBS 931.73 TaxID=1314790 RepID=A0A1Y1YAL5_9FUNG|nr:RNA-binding domain-containing protein [Basidiobolus meristosporus CBS 931.73]|eukprot:ORX94806.1 RNA-binding domain-containing protein [Basidiobolus meristosporus CBS 931.73]